MLVVRMTLLTLMSSLWMSASKRTIFTLLFYSVEGVLDEPYSDNTAQQISHTVLYRMGTVPAGLYGYSAE
jgi:hypothetical protein